MIQANTTHGIEENEVIMKNISPWCFTRTSLDAPLDVARVSAVKRVEQLETSATTSRVDDSPRPKKNIAISPMSTFCVWATKARADAAKGPTQGAATAPNVQPIVKDWQ